MPAPRGELKGLRILVVEDNFLVAENLREFLSACGCDVIGPAPRVEVALGLLAANGRLDGAMLDINLGSEDCFPVAAALQEREVPLLFLTGYDQGMAIPAEFSHAPRLSKPVDERDLILAAREVFGS
jgi:DNA-binding LytR/AlgR family response regulator